MRRLKELREAEERLRYNIDTMECRRAVILLLIAEAEGRIKSRRSLRGRSGHARPQGARSAP